MYMPIVWFELNIFEGIFVWDLLVWKKSVFTNSFFTWSTSFKNGNSRKIPILRFQNGATPKDDKNVDLSTFIKNVFQW